MPPTDPTDIEGATVVPPARPIDVGGLVASALLLLIAGAALWESRKFSALGSIFPRAIGAVMVVASVIVLWRTLRGRAPPSKGFVRDGLLRGLLLIAVISLWIAMLERAGFALAGVIAYVALALITEREPLTWRRLARFLVVAVAFVAAFQLVFVHFLKVQLPVGTLF